MMIKVSIMQANKALDITLKLKHCFWKCDKENIFLASGNAQKALVDSVDIPYLQLTSDTIKKKLFKFNPQQTM